MPEYVYRAVTKQGQIVRNKVEEVSKNTLVKKLKHNDKIIEKPLYNIIISTKAICRNFHFIIFNSKNFGKSVKITTNFSCNIDWSKYYYKIFIIVLKYSIYKDCH